MAYRIEVVSDDCMSSGKCVADNPRSFAFDGNQLGALIPGGEPLSDEDMVRLARNCPSQALVVFDEHGYALDT